MSLGSKMVPTTVPGKMAYVFPGQGSQQVGMGKELYASCPRARDTFDRADAILGFPLSRLCFEGPEADLTQTINAQPAVLVTSLAYLEAARLEGLPPADFFAGHSLGECTALVASGALSFEDALRLVRERGRLMQKAGEKTPGGMLAVLGSDDERVDSLCAATGMVVANRNCPGQVVISGGQDNMAEAMAVAQRDRTKVIRLKVSGAFHSPLMQPAKEGLALIVPRFEFAVPSRPVVANVTAEPIRQASDIREELVNQVCCCVQWQRSVENMMSRGVTAFIEIGPGAVLSGLIKRTSSKPVAFSVNSVESIGEVARLLASASGNP
ncbi:MAG: ACP S-malonyltransferase [Chloroflexota bacterium]